MIPNACLYHHPLDVHAMREAAHLPSAGAVVVFEGCARDHHQGQSVTSLAYEAYEPMALAQLQALRDEAMTRFHLDACLIHHRLGEVPLTEAAVVVVTASAHRQEAFAAAMWVMDETKQRVPVWKRETYTQGGTAWVEGERRTTLDPAPGSPRDGSCH